jgi:hypothetical protein
VKQYSFTWADLADSYADNSSRQAQVNQIINSIDRKSPPTKVPGEATFNPSMDWVQQKLASSKPPVNGQGAGIRAPAARTLRPQAKAEAVAVDADVGAAEVNSSVVVHTAAMTDWHFLLPTSPEYVGKRCTLTSGGPAEATGLV